jgi:tetratricopeptide (TPR) repeat protein
VLRHLGIADHAAGRLDAARANLEKSSQLRRRIGLLPGVAANLVGLIYIAAAQGRRDDALAIAEEALAIAKSCGAHRASDRRSTAADMAIIHSVLTAPDRQLITSPTTQDSPGAIGKGVTVQNTLFEVQQDELQANLRPVPGGGDQVDQAQGRQRQRAGRAMHHHAGRLPNHVLVALALSVAGVPPALIAADYALTDGT